MSILLTKVRPPQRRKDILRRVRLVDSIHQSLHRKLTFVSAPAGYGKTTLLVDFASDVDAIVCWYLISPDDNDLLQFVRHIVAAFQQQIDGFGKDLEELLSSPGGTPDPSTLAHELINEVERKVDDFCVLILDDYHLAGENELVVDFIESLLEYLPDHLRILIGSRSVYGIPTANLYIRDELVTISADELRFRADEIQKLVLQNYHIRLPAYQAEDLASRADGWIVALLLALRSIETDSVPQISGATEKVYSYLAEEVVNRQDPELRSFMYSTSIVSDFNEELCNYLLERKNSKQFLQALEDRNLFVSRTETKDGPSYRYHQLFAEFLYGHFESEQPEDLTRLQERAADWYRQKELWENAIRHKLVSKQFEQAAGWMDKVASQFYTQGRQSLLARWYEELERTNTQEHAPRLLLYYAKVLINQSQLELSEELLRLAEQSLSKNEAVADMANLLVTRAMLQRFKGNFAAAEQLAKETQALVNPKSGDDEHLYRWSQAERILGISSDYTGDHATGVTRLMKSVDKLQSIIESPKAQRQHLYFHDLAETYTDLGIAHLNSGDIMGTQQAFSKALELRKKNRSNPGPLAIARSNMAYIHHQTGKYRKAWQEYELALELAKSTKWHRNLIGILIAQASLLIDLEELDQAEKLLRRATDLADQQEERAGLDGAYLGLSEIARLRQKFDEALAHLREGFGFGGQILGEARYHLHLAMIYRDMGQLGLAEEELDQFITDYSPNEGMPEEQVLGRFIKAQLLLARGEKQAAMERLQNSLAGVARLGYDQFLVVAARNAGDLLSMAEHSLDTPQLKSLIERVNKFAGSSKILEEPQAEGPPPGLHLEVTALGNAQVRKNNELLPISVWRSNRARALFFYLVDRGRVRKEDVGLHFWPDFSPGKISSNFHATLWRVRQALGNKDLVVFEEDHYFLHPSIALWYDVAEYEGYLKQAFEQELSDVGKAELLRRAIALYSGGYLTEVFMEWADTRRDELQGSYIDAILRLAELEKQSNRLSEARELYKEVLNIDPFRDEVHLAFMECLVESGSPSAAKAHFQKYRNLLRNELNADPLPELQKFYEKLPV